MPTIPTVPGLTQGPLSEEVMAGLMYADNAICFTAFGIISERYRKSSPANLHLFALALESALKSLALRSGATFDECKGASHHVTKMISLLEQHGSPLTGELKLRLSDDEWFKDFFIMSRYPRLGPGPLLHNNYPEMIEQVLGTSCKYNLTFDGGSAECEVVLRIQHFKECA